MNRRTNAISLLEATRESAVLAHLADLASESKSRLELISPLLPKPLLHSIHPGPVEGTTWCLLLDSNAIAAKIRQLLPALVSHLNTHGYSVQTIRLKVQSNVEGKR